MSDIVQAIGNAGLDAAGVGAAGPIWDLFFPSADGFTDVQISELSNLLAQKLNEQSYQEYCSAFAALGLNLAEYFNDTSVGTLDEILTSSEAVTEGILSFGDSNVGSVYIAAAALHILALRLEWDIAPPNDKPGAAQNIANAAMAALDNLRVLESDFAKEQGWVEFLALRQSCGWGNGQAPSDAAVASFGADYASQINKLVTLVMLYAPSQVATGIKAAPYELRLIPYDSASTPRVWSASDGDSNVICAYKCQALPASLTPDFFPISDLAMANFSITGPILPSQVVYIAARSATLISPSGYMFVFDDTDSGASTDYSGFYTIPQGVGSFSAASDDVNTPDNSEMIRLCESQYYCQVPVGECVWSENTWNEDGSFWAHPQLSDCGVNLIVRSESSPDTVPGLTTDAVTGFLYQVVMAGAVSCTLSPGMSLGYVCLLPGARAGNVAWSTDIDPQLGSIDQTGTMTFTYVEGIYNIGFNVFAVADGGVFACYFSYHCSAQGGDSAYISITL